MFSLSYFLRSPFSLRVCVSRLCVLTVFSVFLLVFSLSLSLSPLPSFISSVDEISLRRRRKRRRRTSKGLDDRRKKEKKEDENSDERRPGTRRSAGKELKEKRKRLHSVECRPSDT